MAPSRTKWIAAALGLSLLLVAIAWMRARPAPVSTAPATSASAPTAKRTPPRARRAEARASVEGQVVDPARAPIAHATVCATASSSRFSADETRKPTCVETDAAGRYRFADLVPARYRVEASAPRYRPARYRTATRLDHLDVDPGRTVSGVDIVLEPGGVEIQGHVKDLSGGVVRGALVLITSGSRWTETTARTDAAGRFSAWVAEGPLHAEAIADGYAEGSQRGEAPGADLDILLTPESRLVGRVVEAGGDEPVAGARIALADEWASGWLGSAAAFSDEAGRFTVRGLAPGRYKPTATAQGRYGQARESVLLGLGEPSKEIVIEVHPAFDVSGRVLVSPGDAPCTHGAVTLSDPVRKETRRATLERDGSARFEGVLPGSWDVRVDCTDHVGESKVPPVVVASADVGGLVWSVRAGLEIRGRVVDRRDGAVEAQLRTSMKGGDPRGQRPRSFDRTEPDGTFTIKGLLAGTYQIVASAKDHPDPDPVEVEVREGRAAEVKIVVDAGGDIEGTVVEEDGRPVEGAGVRATGAKRVWRQEALTRADGSFRIKGLAPGDYRVSASREGTSLRAPGKSDDDPSGANATVKQGATARVKLVVERRAGEIRGRVLDEHGQPVTDAFVDAERESDAAGAAPGSAKRDVRWTWSRTPSLTDLDGAFVIAGLSRGSYTVRAYRKGGGETFAEHVALGQTLTLTIKAPGSIAGTVSLASGGSPDQFTIRVVDRTSGFSRSEAFFRTAGAFTMADLPAGVFDVSVDAPEGTATLEVPLAESEQKAGVMLTLTRRVTIQGQAVSLQDGAPVPGMRVMASPQKSGFTYMPDDPDRKNITDGAGRFTIARAPAGPLTLSLWPLDFRGSEYGGTQLPIEAGDGPVIDVGRVVLVKRRLGAGERPADLGYELKESPPGTDPAEASLTVALVRPGGPAEAAGLVVGDEIVSVDGHDVRGKLHYLYRALVRVGEGTAVTLGLARGATAVVTAVKPP